jgi:GNAT superfamily N-acetyltransferase
MNGMSSEAKIATRIAIREAHAEDSITCGPICYAAFKSINDKHGFPPDLPSAAYAADLLSRMFGHPGYYCVVAEVDGRIVGSNCLDERAAVCGVGPITVFPEAQNSGVGRKLMEAVLARASARGVAGVRLVQAAFHNRSLSLYTSLGFDVREPLSCMQGRTETRHVEGCTVGAAGPTDIEECNQLARAVHGLDRGRDLAEAVRQGTALVVRRGGRITAYATAVAFFGHAVGETNLDLQAMIASVESFGGPGILVPTRNSSLLRWCLRQGLRVVQPMTLMSMGLYSEPAGAYLPSILF